jgi:hypothetical protein
MEKGGFVANFDVSKPWVILVDSEELAVKNAATELVHYIELLRSGVLLNQKPPLIIEMKEIPSANPGPLIILRCGTNGGNGFSWNMERERLEMSGDSLRGLYNALFDFLVAVGFRWPRPNQEYLPPKDKAMPHVYTLRDSFCYHASDLDVAHCKRLLFDKQVSLSGLNSWTMWAARNQIDALVFSLKSKAFSTFWVKIVGIVRRYGISIEAGGWNLPGLVPRSQFLFHQDMFRMTDGKRDKKVNFCPTSPDTIKTLSKEARKVFASQSETKVFHLWPSRGHEQDWCSCPTCRAFTPEELNRIAVNAAADVLLSVNPDARLSYYEASSEKTDIALRPNVFRVSRLPGESGAEAGGWFLI